MFDCIPNIEVLDYIPNPGVGNNVPLALLWGLITSNILLVDNVAPLLYLLQCGDKFPDSWVVHAQLRVKPAVCSFRIIICSVFIIDDPLIH